MFCVPGLIFGGTVGIGSRFHVMRSQTLFRRYRGRWVPFSWFARPDSFLAVPMASGPVFMFSAVSRASGPVFIFCAPGLVFGGTEGVGVCFHVLRARTRFRRYRVPRVPFSCFARPDSFSAVPRASGSFFMFCAHELVFGGIEGVRSRFLVLHARNRIQRYRGRRVPFSCFARPDSFSAVPTASGPVFKFCAPGLIFGGTEGVGSSFHILRARTHFRRYGGIRVPY
jgi:hypothetical protein